MNAEQSGPAFERTLRRHLAAIEQRNIDDFGATTAADVRLVGTDGSVIAGWDAAVKAHRAWFADGAWRFEVVETLVCDSVERAGWASIFVRYDAGAVTSCFRLFLLFRREADGEWRLTYDQGTPTDAAPP